MNKYECFFEESRKNIYFDVTPYEPNNSVKLSITAYQGEENVIEVCLTEKQVQELIAELREHVAKF